jgi:hypothetical protein
MHRLRAFVNKHSDGHASRIFQEYREFLPAVEAITGDRLYTSTGNRAVQTAIGGVSMERTDPETRIDPILKTWLDNVLVPIMVQQYLVACAEIGDNGCRPSPSQDNLVSERTQ